MSLYNWDRYVKPHLQFIEAGAEMSLRHARALLVKAEFETHAQDQLAEARQVLESALASIIAAQATYQAKISENSHA